MISTIKRILANLPAWRLAKCSAAVLAIGAVGSTFAQEGFKTLYTFPTEVRPTGLVRAKNGDFYGTTYQDGTYGRGTAFRMSPDGTLWTLYSFNSDDAHSLLGTLVEHADGNFYGLGSAGGTWASGQAFKMTPEGAVTLLDSFPETPGVGLTLGPDGNYYGTWLAVAGRTFGGIFRLTPAGTRTSVVSFVTDSNGSDPNGFLTLGVDGSFYGMALHGGTADLGTVFRVTPEGTVTRLVSFTGENGSHPWTGLTLGSDGNFYGATSQGGASGKGTLFKMTPNGDLTTLVPLTVPTVRLPTNLRCKAGMEVFMAPPALAGIGTRGPSTV